MQLLNKLELKPINACAPGELIRLRYASSFATAIVLTAQNGELPPLLAYLFGPELDVPYCNYGDDNDCLSAGNHWIMDASIVEAELPSTRRSIPRPGSLLVTEKGLSLYAGQFEGNRTGQHYTASLSDWSHAKIDLANSASIARWRIWAREADVGLPSRHPLLVIGY